MDLEAEILELIGKSVTEKNKKEIKQLFPVNPSQIHKSSKEICKKYNCDDKLGEIKYLFFYHYN